MKMEDLTRSQYILLVLFVSFFSASVSGIVVFSLLEQAPKDVTRVIQRTVVQVAEKVTPQETKIITEEKRIYIPETDVIKDAITKIKPSIAQVYSNDKKTLYSSGIVISTDGKIITPPLKAKQVQISFDGGKTFYSATVVKSSPQIALFKLQNSPQSLNPATLVSDLQVGTKVVLLALEDSVLQAYDGIISSNTKNIMKTTISKTPKPGDILVSASGAMASIATDKSGAFYPVDVLIRSLEDIQNDGAATSTQSINDINKNSKTN